MNYYEAREIADSDGVPTGLWHYTCRNDDRIWPVGYCSEGCPGHDSPEGAAEHYTEWLLDHILRLDGQLSDQQLRCRVCDAWTDRFAEIDLLQTWPLCDEHRTREHVAKLLGGPVGSIVASW